VTLKWNSLGVDFTASVSSASSGTTFETMPSLSAASASMN
jgi:hypothetical protein